MLLPEPRRELIVLHFQVNLGLCLSGALPWLRGAFLFPAQILGGLAAAGLNSCMFPGPFVVVTRLSPGVSITRGIFIEMFLTAMLVITVLMLAAEKHQATFIAPIGIGLALFIAELCGMSPMNQSPPSALIDAY